MIVAEQTVDHGVPGVMPFDMASRLLAKGCAALTEQFAHRIGHRLRIVRRAEQAALIGDDFLKRPGRHGHHRNAAGHGFEDHQAEGFLIAGMQQRIGTGHQAGDLRGRAEFVDRQ